MHWINSSALLNGRTSAPLLAIYCWQQLIFIKMIEQERKFLLLSMPKTDSTIKIKQGYLMFEGNKHLRVRIIDDRKAYFTFKTIHTSKVRTEYEYEIPLSDAIQMLNNCNCKLEKIRHKTSFEGSIVDIDIYPDGLSVVEIEYKNELYKLPEYCGQEITGMPEYSNVNIAYRQSASMGK